MYILSVIPLTKIPRPAPQVLSYFSLMNAEVGAIVEVEVNKRKVFGVVVSKSNVKQQKQNIKKSYFALKSITRIINPGSVVPKPHIKLALWASSYYYAPLGLVIKSLLPRIFSKPTKKFLEYIGKKTLKSDLKPAGGNEQKPLLLWRETKQRAYYYEKEIKKTLRNNRSVLFLIPELYKIDYFRNTISSLKDALLVHSKITAKTQYAIWEKSRMDKCIILGTRAALTMAPRNPGLIIVDEEESQSHKSYDQAPYINARDMAIKFGGITGARVILGSSMPSLESFHKTEQNEYELNSTPKIRGAKSGLRIVDMREELMAGNLSIFSKELRTKLLAVLKSNGQAILFINRRGLASGLLCRDCGYIIKCPNCEVPMVYHQQTYNLQPTTYNLICHHCGRIQKPPTLCPECSSYKIKFIGAGTQRVEEELKRLLFEHKEINKSYVRMDGDVTPTLELQKETLDAFYNKKYDILIGTQVMLKEGLLPKAALVSIISMDALLSLPDFRINELAFKTIDKLWTNTLSQIILQTYIIDSYVINYVLNKTREEFLKNELSERKVLLFPPFSQIIKLSYSNPNSKRAEEEAKILKNKLQTQITNYRLPITGYRLLGPAPAFIPRQKNSYVWQFLIKSKEKDIERRNNLLRIIPSYWKIDVDPVETL